MKEENTSPKRVKALLGKKWFLPSVYLVSVAMVLIAAVWYQLGLSTDSKINESDSKKIGKSKNPVVAVTKSVESFSMPLQDLDNVIVVGQFYDINADEATQEASLVKYGDSYQVNTGVDYAVKDNQSFDVLASMTGKVTRVQNDALLGNLVEIEHGDGLVTQYSSIKDIGVQVGDQVMQGTVIAKAGQSEINEDAKVHVHFEIRKNGIAVNPTEFLKKPLAALQQFEPNLKEDTKENSLE